jgi:hypothetical protein
MLNADRAPQLKASVGLPVTRLHIQRSEEDRDAHLECCSKIRPGESHVVLSQSD